MIGYLEDVDIRYAGVRATRGWPRLDGQVVGPVWLWEARAEGWPIPERLSIMEVRVLLDAWIAARQARDYPEADRLRSVLVADNWRVSVEAV